MVLTYLLHTTNNYLLTADGSVLVSSREQQQKIDKRDTYVCERDEVVIVSSVACLQQYGGVVFIFAFTGGYSISGFKDTIRICGVSISRRYAVKATTEQQGEG